MHPETLQNKRHMKCRPFITWVTLKLQVATIIIHFEHLQNHKPKNCLKFHTTCQGMFFQNFQLWFLVSDICFWSQTHILRPFGVSGHDHSAVDAVLAVLQPILIGQEDVNVLILPRNRWTKSGCACCVPFLLKQYGWNMHDSKDQVKNWISSGKSTINSSINKHIEVHPIQTSGSSLRYSNKALTNFALHKVF